MRDWDAILATVAELPLSGWRAVLAEFCGSGEWRQPLEALLHQEEQLDRIAGTSFFHPTGGYKLILASGGYDGPEIRLHVWPTGSKVERDHNLHTAHNHKWSFASYVLHGAFVERIFIEAPEGAEPNYDRYCYDSPVRGKQYESRLVGPRRLEEAFCTPMTAGTAYSQSSHLLHTFVPADTGLAATLFVRTRYLPVSHTDVYVPRGQQAVLDQPSGPARLQKSDVIELIALTLGA